MSSSWRPSGVRTSSASTLNRYVPSASTGTTSLVPPTGAAKMAFVRLSSSCPLATQPMSPPLPAVSDSELSRARVAKSAPPSALVLRPVSQAWSVGRYMTWMTCQPKADRTGSSRSARLEARLEDRREEVLVHRGHARVEVRQLAAAAGHAARGLLVALGPGDRVEDRRVRLDPGRRPRGHRPRRPPTTGRPPGSRRPTPPTGRPSGRTGCAGS